MAALSSRQFLVPYRQRLVAQLAVFALLMQILAGFTGAANAAQRLLSSDVPGNTEICTAMGIKAMPGNNEPVPAAHSNGSHCPFCSSTASAPPLLKVFALAFLIAPSTREACLEYRPVSFVGASIFARAQPRAPPNNA